MRKSKTGLAILMALIMGICSFASCSKDDDSSEQGLSEEYIKENLESGSGRWSIVDEDGHFSTMVFQNGKTNGFESASSMWMTPYLIKGNLVYISKSDADKYRGDVLEGGIRITSLTSTSISFYWANDKNEKYTGTKIQ